MAIQYLSEFYSYRGWFLDENRNVEGPKDSNERIIQALISAGNRSAAQGSYAKALQLYRAAWGRLPTVVVKSFPEIAAYTQEAKLLSIDLGKHYLAASAQLLKLRDLVGPDEAVVAPLEPPQELVDIADVAGVRFNLSEHFYQVGSASARAGDFVSAESFIDKCLQMTDDAQLRAAGHSVLASVALKQNDVDRARDHLSAALEISVGSEDAIGAAAARHNLGVALTVSGNVEEAGRLFTESSIGSPAASGWQVTHSLNPGIGSVTRPVGVEGLQMLVRSAEGAWAEIGTSVSQKVPNVQGIIFGTGSVQVGLEPDVIESELLFPRINALTLQELNPYLSVLKQFVGYLTHVGGFVLPMALGDTYFAMGDYARAESYYLKVRNYQYLNEAIERPVVWRKLARTYVQWGNRLYRDRDMDAARVKYEQVARIVPGGFELDGPLYSGGFAPLAAETLVFLEAANKVAFDGLDYGRRLVIMEALANLNQILNGINYLGFPEEIIPIHSWRYLQNTARYFANQASQAERAYISFKDSAEKEAFTRLALEQAVDAQGAALEVERHRVNAAVEQRRVAQLSAELAVTRLENAKEQRADYEVVSQQLAVREEMLAFANAAASDAEVFINYDWSKTLGLDDARKGWESGAHSVTIKSANLVQLMTRARSQISRDYELRSMGRQIAEMEDAMAVADGQVAVAEQMIGVALAQQDLAVLRMEQAQAQLSFFDAQEFTSELWDNLAQAQREISRRYIDWAIGAAFLMERAFEFEYDTNVNRIRFDYERSELNGLLAADFLLADIDSFSYDRLLETEKLVPAKVIVSLADRFPFQYRQQFLLTGRIDFETLLEDFDRLHPGTHLHKLRRVEAVLEGLVGPRGMHGTLTNSGISHYRDRQGTRRLRAQKPETLLLSRFDLRQDGFVFTSEEDVLAVFENSGVASGWILEFPPESNDIDYAAITNIHLVFYFDSYYSERVRNVARAELAGLAVNQHSLGLGLRFQYPDEFFGFQDTGSVGFAVDNAYLPFDHTDARVTDVQAMLLMTEGAAPVGLNLTLNGAAGVSATQPIDANGMAGSGDGAEAFNAFRGEALAGTWAIRIDEAGNEAAFAAGFTWDMVDNIMLFVEYDYTPRGRPLDRLDLSQDPLPQFDIVDDPQAVNDAPSTWAYDAATETIRQTSAIHAPAGAANANSDPGKPGTYLLRKTTPERPALRDFVLSARLQSGSANGIGLVFRWQDEDNFYFFLMDSQRKYRRLGRKIAGVFEELAQPAVDTLNGFDVDQHYEVRVAVVADVLTAYLDGVQVLSGRDASLMEPGRVGLFSWNNPQAEFSALSLQPA